MNKLKKVLGISMLIGLFLIPNGVFANDKVVETIQIGNEDTYKEDKYEIFYLKNLIYRQRVLPDVNNQTFLNMVNGFQYDNKQSVYVNLGRLYAYVRNSGIKYSEVNEYNVLHQIENFENNHTMCQGLTMLTMRIFDKTNVPYRVIMQYSREAGTNEVALGVPGHIYLQVKDERGDWITVDLVPFIQGNATPLFHLEEGIAQGKRGVTSKMPTTYGSYTNIYDEYIVFPERVHGQEASSMYYILQYDELGVRNGDGVVSINIGEKDLKELHKINDSCSKINYKF